MSIRNPSLRFLNPNPDFRDITLEMPFPVQLYIQSVSELTRSIRNMLEGEFRFVHIRGEITNLKCPFSGHFYFTIKDSGAQLKAVLFKGQRKYLADNLKDGQQIVCHGKISVYEPRGEYQLIVDTVDFLGTGFLQLQFEKQKQRLAAEGLFSEANKKELPAFPQDIVLITSPSGAAVHDFLTICKIRKTSARIRILPVRVQGEGAAEEIALAISRVNREIGADLIVLCRGGGSLEDLWAFNEECVARAIYHSRIPVITGIGHEIDFTIADFCADFRSPTPTGAAEKIIPDNIRLLGIIKKFREQLSAAILRKLENNRSRVAYNWRLLGDLGSTIENSTLRLDRYLTGLVQSIKDILRRHAASCEGLTRRLQHQAPLVKIRFQQQHLQFLSTTLERQMTTLIEHKTAAFLQQIARLNTMSPLATLARGYSIVSKRYDFPDEPRIVTDSSQVETKDQLEIRLHQGRLQCEVTGKE
jgi:exodeoxyribonuclease VII large subunit